ncbi:MAG: peptidylprolyl isomerase [Bacteroides helcogenes]|nr:peptidylprolyl isomerase [Bacteroides helcogenes]MDY5237567.1 peptidylprolyl isomerase [Bacteroides helcogenes]
MIKNGLAIVFLCLSLATAVAQDPVLMRINGKDVLRSEFEYVYNKNNKSASARQVMPKNYVGTFIDYKLKVAEAETAGMDTTSAFRDKLEARRRWSSISYLVDEETEERIAHRFYNRLKFARQAGKVRVSHIFKYLSQNISGHALHEIEAKMDSIYQMLRKQGKNADFDACVVDFSDEKSEFWVSWLQMPAEFEDIVFGMQVGEISHPFFTPQGIHIVKVLERRELPPFEEVKEGIMHSRTYRYEMDEEMDALVEKLKKEYHYIPDQAGMDELISKGKTSRVLFIFGGKTYTGREFTRFAVAHPGGVRRQLREFVMKSVLDYENSHLEQKYPEFRLLMQAYKEELLLHEITDREVSERIKMDEAGLKAYFDTHRSDYYWKEPRYKGIVLHCTTKRVAKQVRKFLKQIPESEWMDAIRLTFNAEGTPEVQAEQGLFAYGDNAYVDALVFKGQEATPILSFPFTAILGRKVKGPEEFHEVSERLSVDYRNYLEQRWVAKLRASAKVEINQEVLKTVNNH